MSGFRRSETNSANAFPGPETSAARALDAETMSVASAIARHRLAFAAYDAAVRLERENSPFTTAAGNAERAALCAIFAAPVRDMDEANHKAAYILDEIEEIGDYLQEEKNCRALLGSLLRPDRPDAAPAGPQSIFDAIADLESTAHDLRLMAEIASDLTADAIVSSGNADHHANKMLFATRQVASMAENLVAQVEPIIEAAASADRAGRL